MPASRTARKGSEFRVGRVKGYVRGRVWYLCYFEQGKRRRPRVGPDLEAARQLADQINGQLETGAPSALSHENIGIPQLRDRVRTAPVRCRATGPVDGIGPNVSCRTGLQGGGKRVAGRNPAHPGAPGRRVSPVVAGLRSDQDRHDPNPRRTTVATDAGRGAGHAEGVPARVRDRPAGREG